MGVWGYGGRAGEKEREREREREKKRAARSCVVCFHSGVCCSAHLTNGANLSAEGAADIVTDEPKPKVNIRVCVWRAGD